MLALRHIEPFLTEHSNEAEERAFLTVLAMVCAQSPRARAADMREPLLNGRSTLGSSMAHAVVTHKLFSDDLAEHRLILLARQNSTGIHRLLPRTVLHLRGSLVPVRWPGLIEDLTTWPIQQRKTSKQWIRDYHRTVNRLRAERTTTKPDESETE
ncbi:CRISPR type I-E-associated protein CasB/Cse2 [Stackebrandtia endophytica]|uniref:CRISPR type I-E-associated protein CasB/Cse2 n=1 Tax=Stackebrandtia endophytica TaxID=1496996 RepID=A0A543AS33_9ACTN|nr:CRISPR type I-E-associated protein CasB/Cse2 [Stackebrandtia endophytica]